MAQRSFKIYIESKAGGHADIPQVEAHLRGIAALPNSDGAVLLCLTRDPLRTADREKLDQLSAKYGVRVVDLTFSALGDAVRGVVPDHQEALLSILDDFDAFLDTSGLADRGDRMFVPPTGITHAENLRLGMFFDPVSYPDRTHFRYLGLYYQKQIFAVGEIDRVCEWSPGGSIKSLKGKNVEPARFEEIFSACPYYPNLRNETLRFYFVEGFYETTMYKATKGGIMGARVFYIRDLIGSAQPYPKTAEELASALRGREMPSKGSS